MSPIIAFEVYVNKVKVCTAGIEDFDAILSTLFCGVMKKPRPGEHKLMFTMSGMAGKKQYKWVHYEMYVGSRVDDRGHVEGRHA